MNIFAADAYVGRMFASNGLRSKVALVIACFALGSMTGCAGNPEPKAAPPPVPSSPLPSPSWTPPPAGHWTMKDLEVGRVVPPEELEKLMPLYEVPEAPATIEHATEEAARDATIYFATLSRAASQQRSGRILESVAWEHCSNCDDIMHTVDNPDSSAPVVFWEKPKVQVLEMRLHREANPLYTSKVELAAKRLVLIDETTRKVREVQSPQSTTLYYGVVYYDGRWRPLYMNLIEEPEIG